MISYIKRFDCNFPNISIIIISWILLIVLVNPIGEFPFSDDFSYAKAVQHYLNTGEMHLTDWTSMT
jgi:hypothetical protein